MDYQFTHIYERAVTDITGRDGRRQYGVLVKATGKNKEKGGMLCTAKKRTAILMPPLAWYRKSLTKLEFWLSVMTIQLSSG